MIKIIYALTLLITIFSCSSNEKDEEPQVNTSIIGIWYGISAQLGGTDIGIPPNSTVKFTSDNRTEFVYEGLGNDGTDIIKTGSWSLEESVLTIIRDNSDTGLESYVLRIHGIGNGIMIWETWIDGIDLYEVFKRPNY